MIPDNVEKIIMTKEDNEYLNKVNIELSAEKNRLNNIINEAIELTNKIIEAGWDYDEKDSLAIKLEEILNELMNLLDKENK